LEPPGVPDRFLCILDDGVTAAGVPTIPKFLRIKNTSLFNTSNFQHFLSKYKTIDLNYETF
jgi:hypothetical protein